MTYKELIFTSIGDKLNENGIEKILFEYVIETEKYNLFCVNLQNQKADLQLSNTELTTVRLMFISKVLKQIKKEYSDFKTRSIMLELENSKQQINIFVEFETGQTIQLI